LLTYFANPIILYGVFLIVLCLVIFGVGALVKKETTKLVTKSLAPVLLVFAALFVVLGTVMAFDHAKTHPKCLSDYQAGSKDLSTSCQDMFARYGGGPPQ
jgi:energy-coupling factor transporter transmembrane protein EcfT